MGHTPDNLSLIDVVLACFRSIPTPHSQLLGSISFLDLCVGQEWNCPLLLSAPFGLIRFLGLAPSYRSSLGFPDISLLRIRMFGCPRHEGVEGSNKMLSELMKLDQDVFSTLSAYSRAIASAFRASKSK